MSTSPEPPASLDFRSEAFLRAHIAHTMAFYHPRAIDPAGGFFHYFRDDGTVYDAAHRHLVSSTRFVFNYAMAYREFGNTADLKRPDLKQPDLKRPDLKQQYLAAVHHGLRYLREVHRDPHSGGYAWTLRGGMPEDRTNHCYGLAFVLLAYATALKAGILDARAWMDETWALLEARFWEADAGLYRDEADADWNFSPYRGQNANMHLCEAMLAAFEAGGERRWLDRALLLADHMTRRQAARAGGLVWEHYDRDWNVDWDYHRDDPKHLFRPWGFQPGHQTEWAKLLLILDRHLNGPSFRGEAEESAVRSTMAPEQQIPHFVPRSSKPRPSMAAPRVRDDGQAWLLPTARHLFDTALAHAWDEQRGGIYYGFAFEGLRHGTTAEGPAYVCDDDKYFWVQAESLAAAALLAARTGERCYWDWYDRLWGYAWTHFVDHEHGAWYRILDADNRKYGDEKSPAGKTDYHTMGACYEVLNLLRMRPAPVGAT